MGFVRHIISLVIALLFSALSSVATPMMPATSHQAEFFPHQQAAKVEQTDVHFAARAPPLTDPDVTFTGAAVAVYGNGIIMHGHEIYVASLGFGADFVAPNSVGGSTRIVPGGGLQAHEAAGGHLIQRHVGQTDADLIARLNAQPNITAASSFPNRATAENAVSSALDANSTRINDFLSGSTNRLVLNHDTGSVVGSVVQRGSTTPVSSTSVRVVLQRDASMPTGYRIVTGFPTP